MSPHMRDCLQACADKLEREIQLYCDPNQPGSAPVFPTDEPDAAVSLYTAFYLMCSAFGSPCAAFHSSCRPGSCCSAVSALHELFSGGSALSGCHILQVRVAGKPQAMLKYAWWAFLSKISCQRLSKTLDNPGMSPHLGMKDTSRLSVWLAYQVHHLTLVV